MGRAVGPQQPLFVIAALCCCLAATAAAAAAQPPPPHIWAVMVDDLGWNGMSLAGHNDEVQTPFTAALARDEGVLLANHYVYKFCSPTRASFLTGRIAGHGIQESNFGMTAELGLNKNLTAIGAKLQQAGYVTAQVGKWHQGFFHANYTPHGRGFASSLGFLGGGEDHLTQCHGCENSIPAPDWATAPFACPAHYSPCGVTCPEEGGVDMYCTDAPCLGRNTTANVYLYTAEVARIVRAAAAEPPASRRPRFAFIALHDVHQPVEAPTALVELYPAAAYNDSTQARRVYNGMTSGVELVVRNLAH